MSKEVAQAAVDLLFRLYDENQPDGYINHHTKGIVLDFIGGEPFMNTEVMSFIVSYFIQKCLEVDHIWLMNFRISISSNGLLYFTPAVQEFIKKYKSFLSLGITLDGPKSIHDACRLDWDGNGSFDRSYAAWLDWKEQLGSTPPETKVTISPENLHLLEDTFDFFLDYGCTEIHANPVYEHKWTTEEAQDYYVILKHIADKLLEHGATSSLFTEHKNKPLLSTDTANFCGGTSAMLAFDPDGLAYPCVRYMESSLNGDQPPIIVGDVNGIYEKPEHRAFYDDMKKVTRQSQSSDECINCPVASGCGYCSAWNYQETGSYNKRSMNICWMHRAEALANVYYWNIYYIGHDMPERCPMYLPRDVANQIITDEEYDFLLQLSWTSIPRT